MSKSARIHANQQNAKKSTGPASPAGKAAVAQNARQHGLSGGFSILAHENAPEFDKLLDDYRNEFKPATPDEGFLVGQMAQSRWTLARARRIESHLLNQLAGQPEQPDNADARIAAELLTRSASAPVTIQRYATTAERAYFRARRELQLARSRELRNKANEDQLWLQHELRTAQSINSSAAPSAPSHFAPLRESAPFDDPTIAIPVYYSPNPRFTESQAPEWGR